MRIVVTGKEGQVARSLAERGAASGDEILLIGRPALDLAGDAEEIAAALEAGEPDVIVSAAAYTKVDQAESEPELAHRINAEGAGAVAAAAATLGVPLIHLSTDYVFDGGRSEPYVETDLTVPTGVYGTSKLAGEMAVAAAHNDSAILRTAWVYSPFGSNFVKTMLRLARERNDVTVVADQVGNPTSALDIADAVLTAAANLLSSPDPRLRGIFHVVGSGHASWAELAEQVFTFSGQVGGPTARVTPINSSEYATKAQRPANSRLNADRIAHEHGIQLPDWSRSLQDVVVRLVASAEHEDYQ